MLTEMTEYGHKTEEEVKAILSEIKKDEFIITRPLLYEMLKGLI